MGTDAQAPQGVVIAGTHSGCGKTTVSLALMSAIARRGVAVQPFKVGPDFIDPGLHTVAAGRQSHNLDGWMLGHDRCRALFTREAWDAQLAVVEGVMGLYDGAGGQDETGSTAEMAKWLGLPVLLVVDASSMARSAAALVKGFTEFDPNLPFAGVLFNRVGSERHKEMLWEAMAYCPGVTIAGFLPRDNSLELPSRHLGLHTAEDGVMTSGYLEALADWVEGNLDLGRILSSLPRAPLRDSGETLPDPRFTVRLGVARDKAFCFYYQENFRILRALGAELVFFSPLHDATLPHGLDGLYLGGGYPELYGEQLAANSSMRRGVLEFCGSGKPVYAECGGFMYLMEELHTEKGLCPMVGFFRGQCRMEPKLRSLGYREVVTRAPSILGPAWTRLRGHEFHYSSMIANDPDARSIYKLMNRRGWTPTPEGFLRDSVLGSYVHVHFGSNPEAAASLVAACAGEPWGGNYEE